MNDFYEKGNYWKIVIKTRNSGSIQRHMKTDDEGRKKPSHVLLLLILLTSGGIQRFKFVDQ